MEEPVRELCAAFPQLDVVVIEEVLASVGWRRDSSAAHARNTVAMAAELLLAMTATEEGEEGEGREAAAAVRRGGGGGEADEEEETRHDGERQRRHASPLVSSMSQYTGEDDELWRETGAGGPGTRDDVMTQIERDELLARRLQEAFVREEEEEQAEEEARMRWATGRGHRYENAYDDGTDYVNEGTTGVYEDGAAIIEGVVNSVAAGVNAIGDTLQSTWNALLSTLPTDTIQDANDELEYHEEMDTRQSLRPRDDAAVVMVASSSSSGLGRGDAASEPGGAAALAPPSDRRVVRRANVRTATEDERAEAALLTSPIRTLPVSSAPGHANSMPHERRHGVMDDKKER